MKLSIFTLTTLVFFSTFTFAADFKALSSQSDYVSTASSCSEQNIKNVYKGTISGGGSWAETVFFKDEMTGVLTGIYFMHFSKTPDVGYLTHLKLSNGRLTGKWHDKFGTGTIDLSFNNDCSSFLGTWDGSGGWSGTKTVN